MSHLAVKAGLRESATCLTTVFEWLGVDARVPHWTTVRTWVRRLGVAELEAPVARADDWIWMAHHSNQIGQVYKRRATPTCTVALLVHLHDIQMRFAHGQPKVVLQFRVV